MEEKGDISTKDSTANKPKDLPNRENNYHKSDMIYYKTKHPDFSDALKGRTMTLKTSK